MSEATTGTTLIARKWKNESDDAPNIQKHYFVDWEVRNPSTPSGACNSDCVRHDFAYDGLGNLQEDAIRGGYGNAGWGSLDVSTVTTFKHGSPIEKLLRSGTQSLRCGPRERPASGSRVHLDGSGTGYAYLWDEAGRITDIAPVDGDLGTRQAPDPEWTLRIQRTPVFSDPGLLYGTHIEIGRRAAARCCSSVRSTMPRGRMT